MPRASITVHVHTGHEVVVRESDGATCVIVWVIGGSGALLGVRVVVVGEGE